MFYIMRHGKTDWNAQYRLQGRTDVPLNDKGRAMAREAAQRYADVHFDVCYCSPLARAKETAELVLEGRSVPIVYDDRLMEMCFGIYEGTQNCIEKEDLPISVLFKNPAAYVAVEGGESFEQLYARTGEFLREIVEPAVAEGKDVLVIGHGAMNSSIVCQVRDIPLQDFWKEGIENCRLVRLI